MLPPKDKLKTMLKGGTLLLHYVGDGSGFSRAFFQESYHMDGFLAIDAID